VSHVVLLGLMGAGKTSIGRPLAARLGRPLLDSDEVLERRTGKRTARDLAQAEGIAALHVLEAELALEMLRTAEPAVIAPAASVVEVPEVRDALAGQLVVWLTGPIEHLASKVGGKSHRPLVGLRDPVELVTEQLARREPLVLPLAALVIDVSTTDPETAAARIADLVDARGG
jgi:shikimate kinase